MTVIDDPVGRAARAAARRLASDHGPRLTVDVEAALREQSSNGRPEQYIDPIGLAALIVAAAQLAWSVYIDLRKKTLKPAPEVITQQIRIELDQPRTIEPAERDRVIEIVVDEIVQPPDEPAD
ncbi:MAG: hypothetical protein ACRDQH_00605 [Pseudonocardiaceae bacterium]